MNSRLRMPRMSPNTPRKGAGTLLMHPVAQGRQIVPPFFGRFPCLEPEQIVGAVEMCIRDRYYKGVSGVCHFRQTGLCAGPLLKRFRWDWRLF